MSQPEIRIGDAEREQAVSALGEHYLAGRLSKEEYDERTDAAWAAKTQSALRPLFVDLPQTQPRRPVVQPSTQSRSRDRAGRGRDFRWGVPVFPLIVLVVFLMAVTNMPWFVWVIFGWMWCTGMFAGLRHWGRRR